MQYWIGVLTIVGIYMIAVLGVSILCGFTGMFSMGHAGFMAIGGYVSALLTKNCGMPIFVGILGGMLAASLVGYLISYPTLRLRDDYFIIVTLGIGEAIKLIIQNTESITGGARGFSDVPSGSNVFVVWGVVILTVIGLRSFINSKHGRNCIAVREDEIAARSVGVNIFKYKMEAMIISCALCGCAGAFLAHYMHFLHPNMFTMAKSDELIIVVILGGRGSLTGTILAGLLLLPLPELLRFGSAEQWRMVFYGLLVVLANVPPMIATLGTWYITKGLAYAISNSYAIVQGLPANFGWVNRYVGPFPLMLLIALVVFVVFYVMLNRTLLGKYAYAIGGNSETARLSGIKVNLVRCVLYILTALMSSFVGILMSSRINSGDPNLSTSGIEFEIIVAIILGGTSLLGGQGSLIGTLIGALILGNLSNGMNLLGIGTVYQFIVEGAVLVVAVVLDLTLKGNGLRIKKPHRSR